MNWSLSLAESWWYVLICVLVGAGYAFLLYFKNQKTEQLFKPLIRKGLAVARFLLAALLSFLLLGPVLKYLGYNEEKPIIALFIDNSNSLDEQVNQEELRRGVQTIKETLSNKYRVESFAFSNTITPALDLNFSGTETNTGQALNYIGQNYINQNLGAAIIVSDGINNAGSNPLFATERIKQPVFTVGIGDTTRYADLAIQNVLHNSIAYLGNDFNIKVELKADLLKDKNVQIDFFENGKPLAKKALRITSDDWFAEADLLGTALKVGRTKYTVRVNAFNEEENKDNNVFVFYVDVIDGKKKVEIWADAPHPDIGAIANAINKNENYSAQIAIKQYKVNPETDLVILHNWFQDNKQLNLFEKLKSNGIATWIITGPALNNGVFNKNSAGISYAANGLSRIDALPRYNPDFQFFEWSDNQKERLNDWSPLNVPFGKFKGIKPSEMVLYQKIGSVDTEQPLMALVNNTYRVGLLAGTGIWRWRLRDFEKNGNHETFEDFVTKTVQFLAVKDDKKLLKVYPSNQKYGVGEQVTLLGELYNQSLEALANEEINIVLQNEEGKVYKHTMSSDGNQYKLVLKGLQDGSYTFSATSKVGGVELKDNGYFVVQGQQKERIDLTANFGLLQRISKATGGTFYTMDELDQLMDLLLENDQLKTVIREEVKLKDLLDFRWVFWLLVSLMSLEWLVRKLNGSV
jgi:hypothetical protein